MPVAKKVGDALFEHVPSEACAELHRHWAKCHAEHAAASLPAAGGSTELEGEPVLEVVLALLYAALTEGSAARWVHEIFTLSRLFIYPCVMLCVLIDLCCEFHTDLCLYSRPVTVQGSRLVVSAGASSSLARRPLTRKRLQPTSCATFRRCTIPAYGLKQGRCCWS